MRLVDNREPRDSIREPLCLLGWQDATLDVGDFSFPANTTELALVERKALGQLLGDIGSGQLNKQLNRLCEVTAWPILLLEGQWVQTQGKLLGSAYTWHQIWNYLESWQDKGVRLQLSTSPAHSVQRLHSLADYYAKQAHVSVQRRQPGNVYLDVLCHVRGIGPKKATTLLEAFGDLAMIAHATVKELQSVPGISPDLATRLWLFWRGGGKGA